ncbi:disks large-associated protein 4-like [Bicyclus anynana]|uniref:Disks large-associated protein 4-like n=1 Tax=Bicyclus anynana TaxID=110368 RepID=A0ABM3LIF3_BICAN|nr:disks large-associated protein 4-like [Bicyclus anynana]
MDKALNFSGILRLQSRDNKHKVKLTQFTSVAGGVKKRLETNVKNKRKTRQSFFDNFRNLPECEPQAEPSLTKGEQRMLQLKKWKEEREKKKQEKLNLKKKPFIVGTVKHVLTYEPLPSILRPSSSGRVARSQTSNNVTNNEEVKHKYKFAPKNAAFNPVLKDLVVPPLTVYGREKTAPKKQQPVNNNLLPKPEPRNLRSRTKLNDNTTVKQTSNPGLLSNKTKSNTRKTYVINEPTAKTDIESKIKKISSSSEEETLAPKVKKSAKSKKSVLSKDHITDSIGNPPESDKSVQIILPIVVSPTPIEKLAECSSQPSSMEADVENPQSPKATQSLNTKSTPNRPVNTLEGFTPKNPIPKSESSSEEKLRSPKSNNTGWTPEQIALGMQMISPRVYLSRGKENNRKEMLRKIADGLMDDDYCDMSVHQFKSQLNSEIQNMTEKCAAWDKIAEQTTLPDEIQEEVLAAVGQARLLMAQKMQQFASLVRRCELPEPGQALVTTGDLQGFWGMVFMQVRAGDAAVRVAGAALCAIINE